MLHGKPEIMIGLWLAEFKSQQITVEELVQRAYKKGYADRTHEESIKDKNNRRTWTAAGGDIAYAIRKYAREIEGLPTVAMGEMLGLDITSKWSLDMRKLRQALKALGYKQRSTRYKGTVVDGWHSTPSTAELKQAFVHPDIEDLGI